jgi:mRNA interferase HigB
MRIIARRIIDDFEVDHPDSTTSLETWYKISKGKKWTRTVDIKNDQANASIIANNRAVFNIKGNDYRLVVAVDYQRLIFFIKFLDTHTEYDKIDATTIQYKE